MSKDKIVQGFNNGYILQKYHPELANKIHDGFKEKSHDYAIGFREGAKHYNQEIIKAKSKNYDLEKRSLSKSKKVKEKGKDLDRDFGR